MNDYIDQMKLENLHKNRPKGVENPPQQDDEVNFDKETSNNNLNYVNESDMFNNHLIKGNSADTSDSFFEMKNYQNHNNFVNWSFSNNAKNQIPVPSP